MRLTREDGFGSTGNTLIVCGGFFLAIFGANYQGYNLGELHLAVLTGIAGAFICCLAAGRYESGHLAAVGRRLRSSPDHPPDVGRRRAALAQALQTRVVLALRQLAPVRPFDEVVMEIGGRARSPAIPAAAAGSTVAS